MIITIIIIGVLLYVSCFLFIGVNSYLQYKHQVPSKVDYLIVLGAGLNKNKPSRALRYRIQTAAKYAKENENTVIIASGGKGSDELISEAECIKLELIKLGIKEERIIKEEQSTSTYENLKYSKQLLKKEWTKGILVSNDYHLFRAVKMAKNQGLNVVSLPAKTPLVIVPVAFIRETLSILDALYLKQL
jgi:uncharacterized SAM-binding protein YcdF (DUF218 family)